MPFLVRKLNKRENLSTLKETADIGTLLADLPTTEFRTKSGTLSTWIIDSYDNLNDAVLAITVTSSSITKMDFIVIDIRLLGEHLLEYKKTYAGKDIAVADLQNTHCDILNITVDKLRNCIQLYQSIVKEEPDDEKFIVRFAVGQIKDILKEAVDLNRIDISKVDKKLKAEIDKLCGQPY